MENENENQQTLQDFCSEKAIEILVETTAANGQGYDMPTFLLVARTLFEEFLGAVEDIEEIEGAASDRRKLNKIESMYKELKQMEKEEE